MKDRAYAKINLCLDVIGKREDGYHDLKMIMVPIDFYDVLEMEFAPKTTMCLDRSYLPVNDKNTVIKAIRVMREKYGFTEEFSCKLSKQIPTQAGLAGGSADAASAIRMMNKMLNLRMSREEGIEVAKAVGSDVPFCLFNKPALVEGTGEILTPFSCKADFEILLVKPRRGVSTKTAFEEMETMEYEHPDCLKMRDALIQNDYQGVIHSLGNSMEGVSLKLVQQIRQAKDSLNELGFDGVLMSGSGSTVFGITKDKELVKTASSLMRKYGFFTRSTRILSPDRT